MLARNDCTHLYKSLRDKIQDKEGFFQKVQQLAKDGEYAEREDWAGLYDAIKEAGDWQLFCEAEVQVHPEINEQAETMFFKDGVWQEGFGER